MTNTTTERFSRAANVKAEQALLGAILLRPSLIGIIELEAEVFFDPKTRACFEAMRLLEAKAQPIDEVTLEAELVKSERLDAVGGVAYIAELVMATPTADNAQHYAQEIREHFVTRQVLLVAGDVANAHHKRRIDGDELLDYAIAAYGRIGAAAQQKGVPLGPAMRAELKKVLDDMKRKEAGEKIYVGIPTGWPAIDKEIGGVPRSVITIVCARPGCGKTTFVDNLFDNAEDLGFETLLFSWEDNVQSFAQRGLGRTSGVDTSHIRARNLDRTELARLMGKSQKATERKRQLVPAAGMDARAVVRLARRHKLEHGKLDAIATDYIQKMPYPDRYDEREGINWTLRHLGEFAQEDDIALIVNSQLGRDVEKREDKRPIESDLKGSGNLEQDGKLIIGLYYPAKYLDTVELLKAGWDEARFETLVLKNHQGGGDMRFILYYDKTTSTLASSAIDVQARRGR